MSLKTVAFGLALLALVALYTSRLGDAPIYLAHDEVKFALQAQSIATTGRGLGGERLPVYFPEPEFKGGRDPISIYLTALFLKILPLSEATVRLPSALVGVLDVVLMFFVGRRLFRRDDAAIAGALVLALAPAHFIHSRLALDVIYPLPFALGWLLCLLGYLTNGSTKRLGAATLLLGIGVYSYLPAVFMMPLYLLATLGVLAATHRPRRDFLVAILSFAAALIPLAYWQVIHPERFVELFGSYQGQFDTVRAGAGAGGMPGRVETYWNFFNPGFLFFTGDPSLINSTREAGIFLWPVAVAMIVGIWRLAVGWRSVERAIVLIAFVTAPLAILLMGVPEIRRALLLLPFGALVAAAGLSWLLRSRSRWQQAVAIAVVTLLPFQFASFYHDYLGRYRRDSAFWFGGNIKGALLEVIHGQPVVADTVLLNRAIGFVDAYWLFYVQANGRDDLRDKAILYEPGSQDQLTAPPGSWLVTSTRELDRQALALAGWDPCADIVEADQSVALAVFRHR